MDISQYSLLLLHVYAVLLGGGLGVLYDCFRVTRVFFGAPCSREVAKRIRTLHLPFLKPMQYKKRNTLLGILVFLEDLLFCVIAALAAILLCYEMNNGTVRLFVLFCCGVGFLLYRVTLGHMVIPLLEWIAFGFSCAFRYSCFFLLYPLRFLWRGGKKICFITFKRTIRYAARQRRRGYTHRMQIRGGVDAFGMIPQKDLNDLHRMGEKNGKGKKKTVQPQLVDQSSVGRHRGGFHRNICK